MSKTWPLGLWSKGQDKYQPKQKLTQWFFTTEVNFLKCSTQVKQGLASVNYFINKCYLCFTVLSFIFLYKSIARCLWESVILCWAGDRNFLLTVLPVSLFAIVFVLLIDFSVGGEVFVNTLSSMYWLSKRFLLPGCNVKFVFSRIKRVFDNN